MRDRDAEPRRFCVLEIDAGHGADPLLGSAVRGVPRTTYKDAPPLGGTPRRAFTTDVEQYCPHFPLCILKCSMSMLSKRLQAFTGV